MKNRWWLQLSDLSIEMPLTIMELCENLLGYEKSSSNSSETVEKNLPNENDIQPIDSTGTIEEVNYNTSQHLNALSYISKKSYLASIESLGDAYDDSDLEDDTSTNGQVTSSTIHLSAVMNSSSTLRCSLQSIDSNSDNLSHSPSDGSTNDTSNIYVNNSNFWDSNLTHIDRVIMEIVATERTYVQDLQEIIEGYLIYFKKRLRDDTKNFITEEEICNLFGNLEDIYKFNSSFLSQLESCGLNPSKIAKCFVQRSNGFDVYTQYCTNYPKTVSLLTDLLKNNDIVEIFKELQSSLKHCLPLGSYLLKPVQRILKYHLLLQNIVKHNDESKEEFDDIKNALSVMTNIATHINEMKRKHEHAVRVQEIQSLLYGWEGQDLTTYGELVAEGVFRMLGAKAARHLFLFDKIFLITKKKNDGILSYKAHIMCSNLMVIESIKGEPLCFQTIPFDVPRVQYTFQSRNFEQKRDWCHQLKRLMLENYGAAIPLHAKQIVLELGQSTNFEKARSSLGKRTLSAPEYLERRKSERRKSDTPSYGLHKGFKLRKSLKKSHAFDTSSFHRRIRNINHDTVNNIKKEESSEKRTSLEAIESEINFMDMPDLMIEEKQSDQEASDKTDKCKTDENNSKLSSPLFKTTLSRNFKDDCIPVYLSKCRLTRNTSFGRCDRRHSNSFRFKAPLPLSSGSSELSMISSSPSEDSLSSLCKAYRNISFRSNPRRSLHNNYDSLNNDSTPDDNFVSFYDNTRLCKGTSAEESGIGSGSSNCSSSARTSTPLSSGSSQLSMVSSQFEDSMSCLTRAYRQLTALATDETSHSMIRRVQSFTGMARAKAAILQHTLSFRHSPLDMPPSCSLKPRNSQLKNNSSANSFLSISSQDSSTAKLPSSSSLEEMSPTSPAIWLKKQEKHFPAACKKGGSLPRSFESTALNRANCKL